MNGGNFTKLFASIVTSTIWREADHVKVVWVTMLAICDKHGTVRASVPGLAAIANVSLEHCLDALDRFQSPDPWSRTQEFEGRRIEVVQGGWRLLNYTAHRDGLGEDNTGASMTPEAIRQRRKRERDSQRDTRDTVTGRDGAVTPSASASPSESVPLEQTEQQDSRQGEKWAEVAGRTPAQRREEFVGRYDWGRFTESVDGLIKSAREPLAVIAELHLYLTGELAHPKQTPEMLGYACNQYLAAFSQEGFKTNLFAGVVRGMKRGVERHQNSAANANEAARLVEEKRASEQRDQEERDRDFLADFERRNEGKFEELKGRAAAKVKTLGRMTEQMREVLAHDELIKLVRAEGD